MARDEDWKVVPFPRATGVGLGLGLLATVVVTVYVTRLARRRLPA